MAQNHDITKCRGVWRCGPLGTFGRSFGASAVLRERLDARPGIEKPLVMLLSLRTTFGGG